MNFNDQGVLLTDISFYQDDNTTPRKVDFVKMKAEGIKGVILRAGQGSWIDEDFKDYCAGAKAAGLPRGYYWFYDSRYDPGKQANLWRLAIGNDLPELGLYYDLEEAYKGPHAGEKFWKQFVLAMDVFFPSSLQSVYTANWWWSNQTVRDPAFWSKYPLWVAQYTSNPADVTLPAPWKNKGCILWQNTAKGDGKKYGVESANIDLDKWNGTLEEFQNYFGLVVEPPTDSGDDDMITEAMWNELLTRLDNITKAIEGDGGGVVVPPTAKKESDYNVIEKDGNINGLIVVYKTPDINETNNDRFPVKPPQVVTAINDWRDVPAGLVGWSGMSDIDKQNTWQDWVCLHENQIKNAGGKWREFPDIFLQGGTTRAEYCWMQRSCLGSKVP